MNWRSTAQGTYSQATTAQSGLDKNVQAATSSWHTTFAGSFNSSNFLSDKSASKSDVPHPEIPGSDIPPSQTAHATGSHKPGGWDPPEIPGSVHDRPHPSKEHPSKPPQTEDPLPARGSPQAPLQAPRKSDSQEPAPSMPQHQMPGVPGDLIPPGVPPQLPQSPDSDSPPGVDPSILMSQEQQSGSAQVTENVESQGSGYWAGRVPGTPVSHCDEQQRS
ncbi:hypothetical protein WJX79_010410 [Trebouxia sp. C0005]